MDLKGKGSLLLLLLPTLVLCHNATAHSNCLQRTTCKMIIQDLYEFAIYMSQTVHFHASDLFQKFEKHYSQNFTFILAALERCHTAGILAPAGKEEARLMQQNHLINLVAKYLLSWSDPLQHLGLEAHRLPAFSHLLSVKNRIISLKWQQLEALTLQIIRQLDPEVPNLVGYALWLELPSLQSSKEEARLSTVHSMLRCFVADAKKVDFLLSFLKCQLEGTDDCLARVD